MQPHKTLDITHLLQRGQELKDEIENLVADSQRVIIQQLYDELQMTQDQFDSLQAVGGTFQSYIPDYYIYQTKHNVMEVKVTNPTLLVGKDDVEEE